MKLEPKTVEVDGFEFRIRVPLGSDWLAIAPLESAERSLALILRLVEHDGEPAWKSIQELERLPMAMLLELDRECCSLLEYPVANPT